MKPLLIFLLLNGLLYHCSSPLVSVKTQGHKIITAPGPEDMVTDTSTGRARIIISADDRRSKPRPGGQLQYLSVGDTLVHSFILLDCPAEKIYPHGLATARWQDTTRLFVISHEPLADEPKNYNHHRIHRFRIGQDTLYWEHAYEHKLLRAPNDLFVTDDGQIFVTNYLKHISTWQTMSTAIFKRRTGTTVRYRPQHGWDEIIKHQVYPNGVHVWQNKLFIAEGGRRRILVYAVDNFSAPLHRITDQDLLFADNFSQSSSDQLFITSHPCMLCFSAHARDAKKLSPSLGWQLDPLNYQLKKIFSDDGSNLSAASTLINWHGNYYLSQVFNPYLLIVPEKIN